MQRQIHLIWFWMFPSFLPSFLSHLFVYAIRSLVDSWPRLYISRKGSVKREVGRVGILQDRRIGGQTSLYWNSLPDMLCVRYVCWIDWTPFRWTFFYPIYFDIYVCEPHVETPWFFCLRGLLWFCFDIYTDGCIRVYSVLALWAFFLGASGAERRGKRGGRGRF